MLVASLKNGTLFKWEESYGLDSLSNGKDGFADLCCLCEDEVVFIEASDKELQMLRNFFSKELADTMYTKYVRWPGDMGRFIIWNLAPIKEVLSRLKK